MILCRIIGVGGTAPCFLNLGLARRWTISFRLWLL